MEEQNLDAAGLDPFDESQGQQTPEQEPPASGSSAQPTSGTDDDGSLIRELLADNGIKDPTRIKFVGDNDQVVEKPWTSLTREDKLNILRSGYTPEETVVSSSDYSDEEVELINKIRESRQSPAQYLASLEKAAAQAIESQIYEIDGMSDDELFVYDAMDRYGEENITDEQLEVLLKNAKSDPDLYQKTIETLRAQYKQSEDDLRLQKQHQNDAQQEQEFQNFSETILGEIQSLNTIAGQSIELSVDDMNDLANYMLTRDEEGNSEFGKDMNDPRFFTQVAFWALKGNDIMNEISSQIKAAYDQGFAAGKKGQSQLAFANKKDYRQAPTTDALSAAALDVS